MRAVRVLWGGTALTMNPKMEIIPNAVIELSGGKIARITSDPSFNPPADATGLDCSGCLVMPGLINTHTHVGMSLLRGVADDLNLQDWLSKAIFPLEAKWVNEEFVYDGTRLAMAEMIRSGTTTFNDMYYFSHLVAKAVDECGMRAVCGQAIVETSGVKEMGADPFDRFMSFLDYVKNYSTVVPSIAPHAFYTVSRNSWRKVMSIAEKNDLLVHLHLAETENEERECQEVHGKSSVEFFHELGLWNLKTIGAHAVVLEPSDIKILGKYSVGIAHNPESNLKLGTRISPIVELQSAGCRVGIGTDSVVSNNNLDMLSEAGFAAKVQNLRNGVGKFTAQDAVRALTIEGARALRLDAVIGSLEPGKQADIIAIDCNQSHLTPLYNPYSHLIYAARGSDIKHSIINGRPMMTHRVIHALNEQQIIDRSRHWGERIQTEGAPKFLEQLTVSLFSPTMNTKSV